MRYTCQVELELPRSRVLELMTDPARAAEWMPGLESYTAVQGQAGRPGSVSELRFSGVPGQGLLVEKVERSDEHHHDVVHLVGPVRNETRNTFTDLPGGGTSWVAEHVFHLPPGMAQGLGPIGEQAFRENTQRSMETFKRWAEQQVGRS